MDFIDTHAGRVAYRTSGTGPPLVLLHATLHDHHDFDPVIPRLAAEHQVIAIDWPAHGQSAPARGVTAAGLAATLDEVVTTLGIGPAVYLGNSVGGYAAARLAIDRPHAVAGLVLVNTGGFSPQDALSTAVCRVLGTPAAARRAAPALVCAYLRPRTATDKDAAHAVVTRIRTPAGLETFTSLWRSFATPEHDLRARAHAITAPTLIVWGTRDLVAAPRFGRAALAAIPGAHLTTLPTGHIAFASAPAAFLDRVRPFLRAVRP